MTKQALSLFLSLLGLVACPFLAAWSFAIASLLMSGVALLLVLGALRRRARSLTNARSYALPGPGERAPLEAGDTTICGRVECDDRSAALRVEVVQLYREHSVRGSRYHSWEEVERTVTNDPFVVITDAGDRVLIEPDAGTLFWDDLDAKTSPVTVTGYMRRRTRVATLPRGTIAWVTGRLQRSTGADVVASGDYRAAVEESWTMRSPPSLLVTRGSLAVYHRQRAAMHARLAVFHACLFLAAIWPALGWVDRQFGTIEQGTITHSEPFRRKDGSTGWQIRVEAPSGVYRQGASKPPRLHDTMPVRRGRFTSNLGEKPGPTGLDIILSSVVTVMLFLVGTGLLAEWSASEVAWYWKPGRKFDEKGPGHLP